MFVFGFVFFSASLNNLPGYLLPLLPCLFVVIADGITERGITHLSRGWLIASGILIALIHFAGQLISVLLVGKIASTRQMLFAMLPITLGMLVLFATPLVVAASAHKSVAGGLLVLSFAVAGHLPEIDNYPVLNRGSLRAQSLATDSRRIGSNVRCGIEAHMGIRACVLSWVAGSALRTAPGARAARSRPAGRPIMLRVP